MDSKAEGLKSNLISETVLDVEKNPKEAAKLGRKLASSNRDTYDPIHIKNINSVKDIACELIQHKHYKFAYLVAEPLCNMTMGELKSGVAISIAKVFIEVDQIQWALKMAQLVAPLNGEAKSSTARDIAIVLAQRKHIKEAKIIAELLVNHTSEYAQKAATEIFVGQSEAKEIVFDLQNQHAETVALGIKCAKSNKSSYNPIHVRNMDGAQKIGLALIEHKHYQDAFLVAEPLCNVTMGYLKSQVVMAFGKAFIENDQIELATKMARMVALLQGNSKVLTAKTIALELINYDVVADAKKICKDLQSQPSKYAQNAVQEILTALENSTTKGSETPSDHTSVSPAMPTINLQVDVMAMQHYEQVSSQTSVAPKIDEPDQGSDTGISRQAQYEEQINAILDGKQAFMISNDEQAQDDSVFFVKFTPSKIILSYVEEKIPILWQYVLKDDRLTRNGNPVVSEGGEQELTKRINDAIDALNNDKAKAYSKD